MSDVRKYPLTDDQFERLWDESLTVKVIGETIGHAIVAASQEASRRERKMWDRIAALTGESRDKTVPKIDWINRCIEVRDIESDELTQPGDTG